MGTKSADDSLLRTDNLHNLRNGEIFEDSETGKKFRVQKTALPQHSIGGPQGFGDPNDRTLRRLEADVLIPDRMNEHIQKVACRETLKGLTRCLKSNGSIIGLRKCQNELSLYDECRLAKFNDPWFRQQITDEYIKERAEYRRTGKNTMERRWEEYCDYKRKHGDWTDYGDKKTAET